MGIALSKGDRIRCYTVQEFIAGGGEGAVYLASSSAGALVALKQNRIPPGDTVSRERVLRQKGLIGRRHPAVVEILDVFDHKAECFVVMEYCPGEMLREALGRCRRFSLRQFEIFMTQCLEGLGWLHEQGLIHRDIKPENIVLSALTSTKCTLKIVDVGIAYHIGRSRLTSRGMVGTPLYSSPEQFLGTDRIPDPRSDLYSLGVVGFEILTGAHPYPIDDDSALMKVISSETRPAASSLVKEVPAAVDAWLQKMMALHPEDRFTDTKQALAMLKTAVSAEKPVPEPVPVPEPAPHPHPKPKPKPKPKPRPIPGPWRKFTYGFPFVKPAVLAEKSCIHLNILNGPFKGKAIVIPHEGITLGRAEVNPEDRRVSCMHVRVRIKGERLAVNDLGSVNGLINEGKRTRKATLALGERFAMGDTSLQYEKEKES